MKMHSYMAVNGYLQEVDVKAAEIERKLRERTEKLGGWDQAVSDARTRRDELDQLDTTPSETPALIKSGSYFSPPAATALRNRLQNLEVPPSLRRDLSGNSIQSEPSSLPPAPTLPPPPAIPTPHPLVDHSDKIIATLAHDLSELELELTSTGKNKIRWPANLTWWNYFDYQFLPTLVYELEYPRTER
jgi:sterol O-acyltransferase